MATVAIRHLRSVKGIKRKRNEKRKEKESGGDKHGEEKR